MSFSFPDLIIIYYSRTKSKIVFTILCIEELENGSAISIVLGIKNALRKFQLNIKNMVGIGNDNANVMIGKNKSVHVALKTDVPELGLNKIYLPFTSAGRESVTR